MNPGPWKIRIDTGGTFTDCLAWDPSGKQTRIKVLSSSCLRGTVLEVQNPRRLLIEGAWTGPAGLVAGFAFRMLGSDSSGTVVTNCCPGSTSELACPELACPELVEGVEGVGGAFLEFDQDLTPLPMPGTAFELLSSEPAPLLAARLATGTAAGSTLPPIDMRLATTRGTNALLTRSGSPPVLVINKGFADLPLIGTQARPELFELRERRYPPLFAERIELAGRLDAQGQQIQPLDLGSLATQARALAAKGRRCAAVVLLHADRNPVHEFTAARVLREAGFEHVSCSSDLAPFIRILPRLETAVVNAYLSPLIENYLEQVHAALGEGQLRVMTSAGGLESAESFHPKDSLLSGPAGGIAGAARAGRRAGFDRILTFDMGGTSTDVARYDTDFEYSFEHKVGDAHLVAPALAIESVAAGGGSICSFDGIRLHVGPESASASPGPACYGAGGPLTVTDLNLLLGRLDPERFEIPIDPDAARRALDSVCDHLGAECTQQPRREDLLEGFLELANAKMADAIRRISVRAGYDPQQFALMAFGGAGPQHAFAVAEQLEMTTVIVPPNPSLLSAEGLDTARIERFAEEQILAPLALVRDDLPERLDRLQQRALELLQEEGVIPAEAIVRRRIASMRFAGQDSTLEIEVTDLEKLQDHFLERYQALFAHRPENRQIEIVSLRIVASSHAEPDEEQAVPAEAYTPTPIKTLRARFAGKELEVPLFRREKLRAGARLEGPCLILEHYSTCVVDPGWSVEVHPAGALIGRRKSRSEVSLAPEQVPEQLAARTAAVHLELFSQRLSRIAEEMGAALERTAVSTNVKERLDFSCALLDAGGELLVNAPHIPVHLGSMGVCVREVAATFTLVKGDCIVTNHPAFGGSHLPDVTVISPAHDDQGQLIGYLASRAHHAEIGGTMPGSMPPGATCLAEEGVVIPPTLLLREGQANWAVIEDLLTGAQYPTRALEDNLADLRAAVAANRRGVLGLETLARELGTRELKLLSAAIKTRAGDKAQQTLRKLGDHEKQLIETLDDGAELVVGLRTQAGKLVVDFTGSSQVHPGNLNATPAVVRSAVLYVLRVMLEEDLPLNEGLMRAVELIIPEGILNPPFPEDPRQAPAVVGGNVEISQRLVNALLRGLGLAASSQGTMNNLLFGDQTRSYYETICGGCGAGPDFDGPHAVHSHMTNTRMTDVEILEHRYPVRVHRFAIRRDSGGKGRHPGGDGVVREIEFLAPLSLSLLTQHRDHGPEGLDGGGPGLPGNQLLIRREGGEERLDAVDAREVKTGDRLVIETPGGGGYGAGREAAITRSKSSRTSRTFPSTASRQQGF